MALVGMLLQAQECDCPNGASVGEKLPDGSIVPERVEKNIKAKPIEFAGHKYVVFLFRPEGAATYDKFSVVHSPDCDCSVKEPEKKDDGYYSIW